MAFYLINYFEVNYEIQRYRSNLKDDLPEIHASFFHVRQNLLNRIDEALSSDYNRVVLIKGMYPSFIVKLAPRFEMTSCLSLVNLAMLVLLVRV